MTLENCSATIFILNLKVCGTIEYSTKVIIEQYHTLRLSSVLVVHKNVMMLDIGLAIMLRFFVLQHARRGLYTILSYVCVCVFIKLHLCVGVCITLYVLVW